MGIMKSREKSSVFLSRTAAAAGGLSTLSVCRMARMAGELLQWPKKHGISDCSSETYDVSYHDDVERGANVDGCAGCSVRILRHERRHETHDSVEANCDTIASGSVSRWQALRRVRLSSRNVRFWKTYLRSIGI
jgi:hypothetical protein